MFDVSTSSTATQQALHRPQILLSIPPCRGILPRMRILSANRTVLALGINAVLLLLILISISTKDVRALGQTVASPIPAPAVTPPAAPLTVMPCQLSQNTWGCYVMDPANQTLSVYQYLPHEELRLLAARDMQYDRRLKQYNTSPPAGRHQGHARPVRRTRPGGTDDDAFA